MRHTIKLLLLFILALPAYAQQYIAPVGGVLTVNCNSGQSSFKTIVTATITSVTLVNALPGQTVSIIFTQDATGGHAVTFASNVTGAPTVSTTANATTVATLNYDATSNSWNSVGSGSVSLPTTLSAPGVFTNTQMNENYSVLVGCSASDISTIFSTLVIPTGNFGTDALSGCVKPPASGALNAFESGVAGYAINPNSTASACSPADNQCAAVGVSGMGWATANNAAVWGGNFIASDTASQTGNAIQGAEIDTITNSASTIGYALHLETFGSAQPSGTFDGLRIDSGASTSKFNVGIDIVTGSVTSGNDGIALHQFASGNGQNSAQVSEYTTGSTGTSGQFSFQANGNGLPTPCLRVLAVIGASNFDTCAVFSGTTGFSGLATLTYKGPLGAGGAAIAITSSGVTCTMATSTTCTATVPSGSAHCFAFQQSNGAAASGCAISGTTLTVTAGASNSNAWEAIATT